MKKVVLFFLGLIFLFYSSAPAWEFPKEINYQGMLTTPGGSPVPDGNYSIKFTIWSHATSTSASYNKWEHTYSVSVTNGLFNKNLGEGDPINLPFREEYWLELKVGADPPLSPRTKLVSVGYAYRSLVADTAYVAAPGSDMDDRYVNVFVRDSMRVNSTSDLLRLRNYGNGDALEIWATGGTSADGIIIDTVGDRAIEITDVGDDGIYFDDIHDDGIYMNDVLGNGIVLYDIEEDGVHVNNAAQHGFFANVTGDYGLYLYKTGLNSIRIDTTGGSYHAIWVRWSGGHGLCIDTVKQGDGVNVNGASWEGIDARGARGNRLKSTSSGYYGLVVHSKANSSGNPGCYVYGNLVCTGAKPAVVKTSRGMEPMFAMEAPEVEFVASGHGTLVNGQAQITFEQLFQEAVSSDVPLKIILTPKGGWSGLYVSQQSATGFSVLTGAGEQDIEFDWLAIGRRKGYEQRPEIHVPQEMLTEEVGRYGHTDAAQHPVDLERKVIEPEEQPGD